MLSAQTHANFFVTLLQLKLKPTQVLSGLGHPRQRPHDQRLRCELTQRPSLTALLGPSGCHSLSGAGYVLLPHPPFHLLWPQETALQGPPRDPGKQIRHLDEAEAVEV